MPHPLLYEINTRCWLRELAERLGRDVTLATVPDDEFTRWRKLGFTHIWLMGVWTTGPRARALALSHPELRKTFDEVLPGWQEQDVSGSPYAIAEYKVPPALGGENGLNAFREKLHAFGLKLILDFVPNHLGLDHMWASERPELFVQSLNKTPGTVAQETRTGIRWLAHGKDPYFPAWTDTVQLDYRRPATRAAMQELLLSVAARCDGVRCDMAMLLLNDVFAKTWERFPISGAMPATEFWSDAIAATKAAHPGFLFMAEVYWNLEARLQELGFDYTYDKRLYDELVRRNPAYAQRRLLSVPGEFIEASVHFLENHDERRVASVLSPEEHRAAALVMLGLPGMRFFHEGQLTGARVKVPVQLCRRPAEAAQSDITKMYEEMLATLQRTSVGRGQGRVLAPRAAWPGNPTAQNFVIVQWQLQPPAFDLVVVNLAPHRSQCYAPLTVAGLADRDWLMTDVLGAERYKRSGNDVEAQGLYLDLPAHGAQLFHFEPAA
jgi:Alpha amylase, catalytic domain